MTSPYQTAGILINRAAVQLGLPQAVDPWASSDQSMAQLTEFLSVVGDDLLQAHDWAHLRQTYTFVTVGGQAIYGLPADFHEMVDQSGWNRSTRLPLVGPVTTQQWEYLASRQLGVVVYNVVFRQKPQELEIFNPTANQTIAFDYKSSYWVQDAGQIANVDSAGAPIGTKSLPSQAADLILYDPLLVIRGIKLQFLQAKGFATDVAMTEYTERLQHEIGSSQGAPTLNMNGPRKFTRLLDAVNLPVTGLGQ